MKKLASSEAKAALEFQTQQIQVLDVRAIGISFRKTLALQLSEQVGALNLASTTRTQNNVNNALKAMNFTDVAIHALDEHYFKPSIRLIDTRYRATPAMQEADNLLNVGIDSSALRLREKNSRRGEGTARKRMDAGDYQQR